MAMGSFEYFGLGSGVRGRVLRVLMKLTIPDIAKIYFGDS
jgi:hypothetical protein